MLPDTIYLKKRLFFFFFTVGSLYAPLSWLKRLLWLHFKRALFNYLQIQVYNVENQFSFKRDLI